MKFRRGMHDTLAILPPFPMALRPRRNEDRRTRPATEGAECYLDTPCRYETAHPFPETSGDNRYPRLGAYCRPSAQPITRRWGKKKGYPFGEKTFGIQHIGKFWTYPSQSHKHPHLRRDRIALLPRYDQGVAISLDRLDLADEQFEHIQFAADLRLEVLR